MSPPVSARQTRGARSLEAAYYTSREIYDREGERILARSWLCVGRVSQLRRAGSFLVREAAGEQILLVRDREGGYGAFYNVCRHRGTRLCLAGEGHLGGRISCPYHGWSYDLEGRLVAAPNMPGDFRKEDHALVPVRVSAWEGFLFVNLSPEGPDLRESLKAVEGRFPPWQLERLEIADETDYLVNANWKVIFQNYSECYHCPRLHPHLNRLTPYLDSSNDLEEGPILGGPMKLADAEGSMTTQGARCAPLLGEAESAGRVLYYSFFPSFTLSLFPDYVMVHRIERLEIDRTRVLCQWLFHPEAIETPGFDPSGAIEFWDLTNRQDWQICEMLQGGVSSAAYRPAPYSPLESVVAAFDREYLRQLEGD